MSVYKYTLTSEYSEYIPGLSESCYLFKWLKIVGNKIIIPAGYSWDGCSPKIKIGSHVVGTPDFGVKTKYASLAHDALYQYAGLHSLPRKKCDGVFYELMKREKFIFSTFYYATVRIFGFYFWNKCRKADSSSFLE